MQYTCIRSLRLCDGSLFVDPTKVSFIDQPAIFGLVEVKNMRFTVTIGGLNIIIVINHPRRRPEDFRSVPSADPNPACLRSSVANTFPSYAALEKLYWEDPVSMDPQSLLLNRCLGATKLDPNTNHSTSAREDRWIHTDQSTYVLAIYMCAPLIKCLIGIFYVDNYQQPNLLNSFDLISQALITH